jgi:hypothetical protein
MSTPDPVGELVLLARGAAEAGADWHVRLRREWLPRVVSRTPRAVLVEALAEWFEEAPDAGADLSDRLEAAVVGAMAEQGYQ